MGKVSDIIDARLKELGIKGSKMCDDLGISRSTLTELRKGRATTLKAERAVMIANYLGVSVDYLLGNEEKEKPADKGEQIDLSDIEIGFLGDYKELTEENKATIRDMVRLMRERQKEG